MDAAVSHSLSALQILRGLAPQFCRAAGVDFPASLLAEGLPAGDEKSADLSSTPSASLEKRSSVSAQSLDALIEWWVAAHPDRKGAGLFLTPRSAARALLVEASRDGWTPASVIDPAVGAGVFLLTARDLYGPGVALFGIDRDPMAVASTRLALWMTGAERDPSIISERVRLGDALEMDAASSGKREGSGSTRGFDLVCGNPPFGNAIEKRTARSRAAKEAMARRFSDVARGPYDRSVLFVRLAGELLSPGGRIAFLVPRALLAARYATGLRSWSKREAPITRVLRFPNDVPCAEVAVAMVGWIAERGARSEVVRIVDVETGDGDQVPPTRAAAQPAGRREPRIVSRDLLRDDSWGILLDPLAARIEAIARTHPLLGESCTVRSGSTVEEAYRIVHELGEGGDGWRFLTSGSIARYGDRWGDRPSRYLGTTFCRPILPRDARCLRPARRSLYDSPKTIVCGLSRVLRAREDATGDCAGSVGTFLVLPRIVEGAGSISLRRLTILLNSAWFSMVHRARRGAAALSGGNVPLLRRDIEEFPLPSVFLEHNRLARLDDLDPLRDDRLAQWVVLELAGYDEGDALAIIEAWDAWLEPRPRGGTSGGGASSG